MVRLPIAWSESLRSFNFSKVVFRALQTLRSCPTKICTNQPHQVTSLFSMKRPKCTRLWMKTSQGLCSASRILASYPTHKPLIPPNFLWLLINLHAMGRNVDSYGKDT
ncbi:homeobox protein NANOG, partial [Striga asiatica]